MSQGECLVCGKLGPITMHHWPRTRRYGKLTVPLCWECHVQAHSGNEEVIETLIREAPMWWKLVGVWPEAKQELDTFVARREYIRETSGWNTCRV